MKKASTPAKRLWGALLALVLAVGTAAYFRTATHVVQLPIGDQPILPDSVAQPQQSSFSPENLPAAPHTANFGWSGGQTLHGILSGASLYFKLPSYWDTQFAYVELAYSVTQLAGQAPSTITLLLNEKPFYSAQVFYSGEEKQLLRVPLPMEELKEGYNNLEVSGYLRLFDEEGCIDDSTDANWLYLEQTSRVRVGYQVSEGTTTLLTYPYPLLTGEDTTGEQLSVLVSDAAANDEVAAALLLSADLAGKLGPENKMQFASWSSRNSGQRLVYVGLDENTPSEIKELYTPFAGHLEERALILLTEYQGTPLLLVVSKNGQNLTEAVQLITDESRISQEKGSHALVELGASSGIQPATNPAKADRYTLEEMTGGGLRFVGPFRQTREVILPVAGDFLISSQGKVTLDFRYSKNLDFNRSMLTVYVGNVPVASKKLEEKKAQADSLTFQIPSDLAGTAAKNMVFAFDLEIPDMFCTTRQSEMPWAYLTGASSFYMPPAKGSGLRFENRPAPFQQEGRLSALVVLPDAPTQEELLLLSRIAAVYGTSAQKYGQLAVRRAGELVSKELQETNVIAVGTPADNALLAKLNPKLHFRMEESENQFASNNLLLLSDQYAKSMATLQLVASPYGENQVVLAAMAVESQFLSSLSRLLGTEKLRWNLQGDCVVTGTQGDIRSFQFRESEDSSPRALSGIAPYKRPLLFTLLGTLVMLLLLLAIALIAFRMRINIFRKNKKDETS